MYCKSCGAETASTSNYCIHDGELLKSVPYNNRFKTRNNSFCSSCGTKNSTLSAYCQNCGESLIQYGLVKNVPHQPAARTETKQRAVAAKQPGFELQYIKSAVIPAAIAIIVVFLLSFSMLKASETMYDNLLNSNMNNNFNINSLIHEISSETNTDLPQAGKLIGISDVLMDANLQSPEVTIKGSQGISLFRQSGSFEFLVQNGFLVYLLIPFIGLFIAGIFAGRRNNRTQAFSIVYDSIGIALVYSVFFTIMSFFAGFHYHINVNVNSNNVDFDINTKYSFVSTFFMTLLFGFIFSFLGNLFSINFKKITGHLEEWIPSGRAIHHAFLVPFSGFLILFAGLFIYLTSKFSDFKDQIWPEISGTPLAQLLDNSTQMIATLSFQLAGYLWHLLNFEAIKLTLQGNWSSSSMSGTGTLSYSIFSGFTGTGSTQNGVSTFQSMLSSTDTDMYLKFALLIPIALFVWTGYRLSQQGTLFKNLLIFSLLYGIIVSGIAAFSDLGFNFRGNIPEDGGSISLTLGFGALSAFIRSFIFSFVFAYLGSWITKLNAQH